MKTPHVHQWKLIPEPHMGRRRKDIVYRCECGVCMARRKAILALLKAEGRGSLRCRPGFLIHTTIQSIAEDFMYNAHHPDFFFVDPTTLPKDEVGNFIYDGLWVSLTEVRVKVVKKRPVFTIP